jgi:primosomal protein N'
MCDPNRWLKERCGRKTSATTVCTECAGKVIRYRMLGDGKLIIKLKHNEIYEH